MIVNSFLGPVALDQVSLLQAKVVSNYMMTS